MRGRAWSVAGGGKADAVSPGGALGCVACQSRCCPFFPLLSMTPPTPFSPPSWDTEFAASSGLRSPPHRQAHPVRAPSSWTQPPASSAHSRRWSLMLGPHAPLVYCCVGNNCEWHFTEPGVSYTLNWVFASLSDPLQGGSNMSWVMNWVSGRLRKLSGKPHL